jgi:hypothetical protein
VGVGGGGRGGGCRGEGEPSVFTIVKQWVEGNCELIKSYEVDGEGEG